MLPYNPLAEPVSSFVAPAPLPTADPDAGEMCYVHFAREWLPYLLGALSQLMLQTTWRTDDPAQIALAQARSMSLITLLAQEAYNPMALPAFRFTELCGMEVTHDGENYEPVPGWDDWAAACFTGPAGPQGIQGIQGIQGVPGTPGADATTLVGTIIMTVTTQSYTPPKYLLCNGASYLRSAYPDLVAVISTGLYDPDGVHFFVPEMRGRFPRGEGTGPSLSTFNTNQKGGAETHTLTVGELPAHHHTMRRYNSASGALPGQVTTLDATMSSPQDTAPDTGDTGGDTPFSILPPQYGVRFWIRALP